LVVLLPRSFNDLNFVIPERRVFESELESIGLFVEVDAMLLLQSELGMFIMRRC